MLMTVIVLGRAPVLALALLLMPLALGSCASRQSHVNDIQQLGQRLQGTWVLKNFTPKEALEPALYALLTLQFGQMRVTVQGSRIVAQGPGLQVVRTFQIQEAFDTTATLLVVDQSGIAVRVWIEIRDQWLTFRPMDSPWTGEGVLQRG